MDAGGQSGQLCFCPAFRQIKENYGVDAGGQLCFCPGRLRRTMALMLTVSQVSYAFAQAFMQIKENYGVDTGGQSGQLNFCPDIQAD